MSDNKIQSIASQELGYRFVESALARSGNAPTMTPLEKAKHRIQEIKNGKEKVFHQKINHSQFNL